MANEIMIAGRRIGPESPPYIVAELSANHGGSLQRALDVMEPPRPPVSMPSSCRLHAGHHDHRPRRAGFSY